MTAPGLTLLVAEHWSLIIAATVSMQRWSGNNLSHAVTPAEYVAILGEDPTMRSEQRPKPG